MPQGRGSPCCTYDEVSWPAICFVDSSRPQSPASVRPTMLQRASRGRETVDKVVKTCLARRRREISEQLNLQLARGTAGATLPARITG
jgi:hypothetical protein